MLQKEKYFKYDLFIYMPKDQIFILQSCRFSSEVLIDTYSLIPSIFVQKVLLCKASNKDAEEMEL